MNEEQLALETLKALGAKDTSSPSQIKRGTTCFTLPTGDCISAQRSSSSTAGLARQGQDPSGHGTPGSNAGPAPPSAGTVSKKAPRKWDQSILSTVCRWRACLCEADMSENGPMSGGEGAGKSANSNPNARYLCRYHAEVCRFLDERYLDEVRAKGGANAKSDVAP